MAGSPIHPSAREARVIPSCVAEINVSSWAIDFCTNLAGLLPFFTNTSIRVFLTATNANSEATKKPFRKTRSKTSPN